MQNQTLEISSAEHWVEKALLWANVNFKYVSFHRNNDIDYPHQGFKSLLAVGNEKIDFRNSSAFEILNKNEGKWLFGYLGYDIKNEIEDLYSSNPDQLQFDLINFFEPEFLFAIQEGKITLLKGSSALFDEIDEIKIKSQSNSFSDLCSDYSREEYVSTVSQLIDHIIEGDCYEINLCQGFHGTIGQVSPVQTYLRLNELSPKPFSCFQKFDQQYILCASPERFLKKEDETLISQPIKGTRPRGATNAEDIRLIEELKTDKKEKAENLMIVDLVRNDLARSSKSGSVKVEELFGIYSFQQVHQMISTVTSEKKKDVSGIEAIKNAFPMGSMTGAPKIKVMQLIEQYEKSKRGAFSGASGYIEPNGDFDFNVLIRSLFLNTDLNKFVFHVGSAITYDAIAEHEYEECLVKAKAILQLINE